MHRSLSNASLSQQALSQQSIAEQDLKPIVWSIAGSDSGGGAGIQADLATIQDLACHGCSAITTITAQNSVTVSHVEAVSEAIMLGQLTTLAADLPPKAIKVGLLAHQKQLELVAGWLKQFKSIAENSEVMIIVDPVMVATCGNSLNQQRLDFSPFMGLMDLLTPNQAELNALYLDTGGDVSGLDQDKFIQMQQMADYLQQHFQCNLLAKGGDASWQQQSSDLYLSQQVAGGSEEHNHRCFLLQSPRIDTLNNHGSGCTLSSAIASFLAHDLILHDAIVLAKAYVNQGLMQSTSVGQGPGYLARTGWPIQLDKMPNIIPIRNGPLPTDLLTNELLTNKLFTNKRLTNSHIHHSQLPFKPVSIPLGVYPVVADVTLLHQLLEAGCKTIQLRIKAENNDAALIEAKIVDAIELGRRYQAQVFINDHWQLAVKHQAFGVHLGQEDVLMADLTLIAQQGLALGLSSHSYFEILLASQLNPSYIALGHIYPTSTKTMPSAPQGLKKLTWYNQLIGKHFATVAIGGIDLNKIEAVAQTGVQNIAVVRAITEASDPVEAYQQLQHQWQQWHSSIIKDLMFDKPQHDKLLHENEMQSKIEKRGGK